MRDSAMESKPCEADQYCSYTQRRINHDRKVGNVGDRDGAYQESVGGGEEKFD